MLYNQKIRITGVFLWIKDTSPDPESGDPKRMDPTGSGSATLVQRVRMNYITV